MDSTTRRVRSSFNFGLSTEAAARSQILALAIERPDVHAMTMTLGTTTMSGVGASGEVGSFAVFHAPDGALLCHGALERVIRSQRILAEDEAWSVMHCLGGEGLLLSDIFALQTSTEHAHIKHMRDRYHELHQIHEIPYGMRAEVEEVTKGRPKGTPIAWQARDDGRDHFFIDALRRYRRRHAVYNDGFPRKAIFEQQVPYWLEGEETIRAIFKSVVPF